LAHGNYPSVENVEAINDLVLRAEDTDRAEENA